MALTSGPVVEIPVCDHSNENFFAILSYDAVYLATVLKMNYLSTLSSFGEEGKYEQTKRPFSLYIAALVSDALINSVRSKYVFHLCLLTGVLIYFPQNTIS